MIPSSLAHRLITTHSTLHDVWLLLHPDSAVAAANHPLEQARRRPAPNASYNVEENGMSCDSVLNTWRWSKHEQKRLGPDKPPLDVEGDTMDPKAKRLDYVFASTGTDPSNPESGGWVVTATKLGMLDRHPDLQCSLSDHFSVEATLTHSRNLDSNALDKEPSNGAFLESPAPSIFYSSIVSDQLKKNTVRYLPIATYDEILAMIYKYRLREKRQRRLRMGHFVGSVFVSIACFIGVWFSPNYVAFLLMLVSTLGLAAGVIDGLIGGLFVGSEIRALKEFEWEISNAKAAANGEAHHLVVEGIKDW